MYIDALELRTLGIITPSTATLRKYGLDEADFVTMVERQEGGCAICRLVPTKGRLNIDHEHVRGWKKMPPEKRKIYVRGLLCYMCNHYLMGRGSTMQKHINAAQFIRDYKVRRLTMYGVPIDESIYTMNQLVGLKGIA